MQKTIEDLEHLATLFSNFEVINGQRSSWQNLMTIKWLETSPHLKVIRPIGEYSIPVYKDQAVRIPNIMEIHEIFKSGGYDRIICSTESPMGLAGLYLKKAFNIPAYFFMHTDWVEFAKRALNLPSDNLNRLTRILRTMYRSYDKLFVLNSDHKDWLTGRKFAIKPEKIADMLLFPSRFDTFGRVVLEAIRRAKIFSRESIFNHFLRETGLEVSCSGTI